MIKNTSYDICNKTMKLFKKLEQKLGKKMNNMATKRLEQRKEFRVDNKEREVHDEGPGDELKKKNSLVNSLERNTSVEIPMEENKGKLCNSYGSENDDIIGKYEVSGTGDNYPSYPRGILKKYSKYDNQEDGENNDNNNIEDMCQTYRATPKLLQLHIGLCHNKNITVEELNAYLPPSHLKEHNYEVIDMGTGDDEDADKDVMDRTEDDRDNEPLAKTELPKTGEEAFFDAMDLRLDKLIQTLPNILHKVKAALNSPVGDAYASPATHMRC